GLDARGRRRVITSRGALAGAVLRRLAHRLPDRRRAHSAVLGDARVALATAMDRAHRAGRLRIYRRPPGARDPAGRCSLMGLRDRLDVGYPQLVLVALTVVTVVGLVLAASTSSVAFGSYNDAWDGASELREQAQAAGADSEIVRDTDRYANASAKGTVA